MTPPAFDLWPSAPGRTAVALEDEDRHIMGYVALERRRFEVLGSWVASTPELDVKQALARHARHHAWHASLWEEHLPHRSGYRAPGAGAAAGGLAACLDALASGDGPEETVERLAGAYRVVTARAVAGYTRHLARLTLPSGSAMARTVRLVLADQVEDWREGEVMLQSLLDSDELIERAAQRQAALERLALAADTDRSGDSTGGPDGQRPGP